MNKQQKGSVFMYLVNFFRHLRTVIKHKTCVAHYCFMCGLYYQGIMHDMSKFSPVEFFESVKYYQGTSSPIDACKEANGYSEAWFHHRGRNKHHWEYWVDDFQKGVIPKKMPFRYALEMICDFLGAGRAYTGNKFSIRDEYDWWQNKKKTAIIHPDTIKLIDIIFDNMLRNSISETLTDKKFLHKLEKQYDRSHRSER